REQQARDRGEQQAASGVFAEKGGSLRHVGAPYRCVSIGSGSIGEAAWSVSAPDDVKCRPVPRLRILPAYFNLSQTQCGSFVVALTVSIEAHHQLRRRPTPPRPQTPQRAGAT